MAVKFTFGAPPKTFTRTIKFTTLEGVREEFEVTFNYRNRKDFGEFFDEMSSAARARMKKNTATQDGSSGEDKELTMTDIMEATTGDNSKYLLKALSGWELEQPLDQANAERLANEFPAAAGAIMEAYRTACMEGRLGN